MQQLEKHAVVRLHGVIQHVESLVRAQRGEGRSEGRRG
jgi:hypothetical protein